jgi:cyclohexa-1,5-dienecarbonyl-CoA hydratase
MNGNSQPFTNWQVDEGVGFLTLNRPPLNILHIPMIAELETALQVAATDHSLRLLVLQAEGKLFSAGVDIGDHTADRVGEMIPLFNRVCQAVATFPAPTLAVVHGHALGGGCELVLCCDLIVAAEHVKIGQPEIKLATFAPIASLLLPALVGRPYAAELLFTGEPILAADAARLGLINRAVPAEELETTANTLIDNMRSLSAAALRLCKQALNLGNNNWHHLETVNNLSPRFNVYGRCPRRIGRLRRKTQTKLAAPLMGIIAQWVLLQLAKRIHV